ncbi:YDG domain-containing protein [Mycena chlorophos]|uniref:YDG domain-containing protein n=1 Tax=Mycena chlorophos TaxID=658473 RepID=A0A8H6SJN1_MYCCL|nr:YDG domain-containing protein [Mycena chlorophos]
MCSLRPDPQVHNDIRGIPVGTLFADRADVYKSGLHGNTEAGIFGTKEHGGAFSIVVNGTYSDDKDEGDRIIFTGEGRGKASLRQREREGGIELKPKNKNSQLSDQNPNSRGNRALRESLRTHYPIRVIRGPEGNPAYCPVQGYRYDGLYEVVDYKFAPGIEGYKMCFFTLQRCTSFTQAPLPLHITGDKAGSLFWSLDRDSAGETLNTPIPVRSLSQRKDSVYVSSEDRYRAIAGKKRIPDTKIPKRAS